jgi:hypothetical protein
MTQTNKVNTMCRKQNSICTGISTCRYALLANLNRRSCVYDLVTFSSKYVQVCFVNCS